MTYKSIDIHITLNSNSKYPDEVLNQIETLRDKLKYRNDLIFRFEEKNT